MKTKTLVHKVTDAERRINQRLLDKFGELFHYFFMDYAMHYLLHPAGRFFGNMNNIRAVSHMRNLATGKNGIGDRIYQEIKFGVATDHRIGEVVMELRFSDFEDHIIEGSPTYEFGDPSDFRFDERIFYFAFTFKDGKIFSIRTPRSFEKTISWIAARN